MAVICFIPLVIHWFHCLTLKQHKKGQETQLEVSLKQTSTKQLPIHSIIMTQSSNSVTMGTQDIKSFNWLSISWSNKYNFGNCIHGLQRMDPKDDNSAKISIIEERSLEGNFVSLVLRSSCLSFDHPYMWIQHLQEHIISNVEQIKTIISYQHVYSFRFLKTLKHVCNCSSNVVSLYGYKRVGIYGAVPGASIWGKKHPRLTTSRYPHTIL